MKRGDLIHFQSFLPDGRKMADWKAISHGAGVAHSLFGGYPKDKRGFLVDRLPTDRVTPIRFGVRVERLLKD